MIISFDESLKIAGIGLVPWTRLGPEKWLPNYAIASLYGGVIPNEPRMPKNFSLSELDHPMPKLKKANTGHLLQNVEFQQLLAEKLANYELLTYRSVTIPAKLKNRKFLLNETKLAATLENKVEFRKMFADKINFPPYKILNRDVLKPEKQSFENLMSGRSGIVIQDEKLSGGKGTFIIRNFDDYIKALSALDSLSINRRAVVSDEIKNGRERSIQCCVGSKGVYIGPLQRQIVRDPKLVNMNASAGNKFCGASIDAADQSGKIYEDARRIAKTIAKELMSFGYLGIFGIDFLLDENDDLFVLELNPRLTGVTPLLTSIYLKDEGIPFYLLHLLELGNHRYTVKNEEAVFDKSGGMLMLHSLESLAVKSTRLPQSGTYVLDNNGLPVKKSDNVYLENAANNEFVVKQFVPIGATIKPGARMLSLEFNRPILDNSDRIYDDIDATVVAVKSAIETGEAEINE